MKNSMNLWTQFPFNSKILYDYETARDDQRWDNYFSSFRKRNSQLTQNKEQWQSVVDYPGVDPANISVTVANDHVCIKAPDLADVSLPFDTSKYDIDKLEVTIKFGRLTASAPAKLTKDSAQRTIKIKTE